MRGAMKIGNRPKRFGPIVRAGWPAVLSFIAGVVLIAVGLELFLKPNRLVAGGAQSISIMLSHMTEMRLGLFLFLINVPFLFIVKPGAGGWKRPAFIRTAALSVTAAVTLLLDPIPPLTEHSLAASLLGGLALGCGAGFILRIGGYTDGVNEAAFWVKRKVPLSIGELVMLINLLLLTIAGFLFGWEQAFYSVIAYYVAYRSLRYTMRGYHRYTLVRIRGGRLDHVHSDLQDKFGTEFAFLSRSGSPECSGDMTVIISREQEDPLREILRETDPAATIHMTPLSSAKYDEYNYLQ
ncbi:YitT family protein [Paenibacillus mesophilus]|uniref:YitT family protein n=1 Tax=Paenibacillus mesophilus TaxID=2582849 RepID=UPI0013052874|nr:YitT family protein [Paenibacillus mesophilus]